MNTLEPLLYDLAGGPAQVAAKTFLPQIQPPPPAPSLLLPGPHDGAMMDPSSERKFVRQIVRQVHPDLFSAYPYERAKNSEALKVLSGPPAPSG